MLAFERPLESGLGSAEDGQLSWLICAHSGSMSRSFWNPAWLGWQESRKHLGKPKALRCYIRLLLFIFVLSDHSPKKSLVLLTQDRKSLEVHRVYAVKQRQCRPHCKHSRSLILQGVKEPACQGANFVAKISTPTCASEEAEQQSTDMKCNVLTKIKCNKINNNKQTNKNKASTFMCQPTFLYSHCPVRDAWCKREKEKKKRTVGQNVTKWHPANLASKPPCTLGYFFPIFHSPLCCSRQSASWHSILLAWETWAQFTAVARDCSLKA